MNGNKLIIHQWNYNEEIVLNAPEQKMSNTLYNVYKYGNFKFALKCGYITLSDTLSYALSLNFNTHTILKTLLLYATIGNHIINDRRLTPYYEALAGKSNNIKIITALGIYPIKFNNTFSDSEINLLLRNGGKLESEIDSDAIKLYIKTDRWELINTELSNQEFIDRIKEIYNTSYWNIAKLYYRSKIFYILKSIKYKIYEKISLIYDLYDWQSCILDYATPLQSSFLSGQPILKVTKSKCKYEDILYNLDKLHQAYNLFCKTFNIKLVNDTDTTTVSLTNYHTTFLVPYIEDNNKVYIFTPPEYQYIIEKKRNPWTQSNVNEITINIIKNNIDLLKELHLDPHCASISDIIKPKNMISWLMHNCKI